MSGYSSKAEVVEVVKLTITNDTAGTGLSRDPKDYNIAGIIRDNFIGRAHYGWGTTTGAEEFAASLRRNLRRKR
jgi:hypothetical protein